jgi:serine/threonine protein phosphatase PrpC
MLVILLAALSLVVALSSIAHWRSRRANASSPQAASRKVGTKQHRSVSSAALLMSDARPLPRFVDVGGNLELKAARRSRVALVYEDEAEIDEPTAPAARILMSAQGDTQRGRFRARNQDSLLLLREHSVFVVADGMGGHQGGGVASELAVKTLDLAYSQRQFQGLVESERPIPRRAHDLALAIQLANHAVYTRASADPTLLGMGTTLVAARFSPRKQRVYIGHIGDSRCYRIRQGSIRQLTHDHTMASVGLSGPRGQRLVRAVGIGSSVTIDLIVDKPRPNDIYLLCSDGLPKVARDEEILALVLGKPDPDQAVSSLIALASDRGGKDNVTVILVRVVDRIERQIPATRTVERGQATRWDG